MTKTITVSQVNKYLKDLIANDYILSNFWLCGEISNFKNHSSGHLYFTLKDDSSTIKCVMFKTQAQMIKFVPKDGLKVLINGYISVFERDGVYQVYVQEMLPDGVGQLYLAYEQLKEKLTKKGYFDEEIKKAIPKFPKSIGVITSPTGAVIRDILNVSTRRNPNVNIKIMPVAVQGQGACYEIANAIRKFNQLKNVEVIIVARGGGSIEDLWPFNEEVVADAIFESVIPIVSAVGHETDFTICDFVADLRAPTPSAAAEIVVPDIADVDWRLRNYINRLKNALTSKVEQEKQILNKYINSWVFKRPYDKVYELNMNLDKLSKNLSKSMSIYINDRKQKASFAISKLDSLSPLKTLLRGYCIAQDNDKTITSVKQIAGDFNLKLIDGDVLVSPKNIEYKGDKDEKINI